MIQCTINPLLWIVVQMIERESCAKMYETGFLNRYPSTWVYIQIRRVESPISTSPTGREYFCFELFPTHPQIFHAFNSHQTEISEWFIKHTGRGGGTRFATMEDCLYWLIFVSPHRTKKIYTIYGLMGHRNWTPKCPRPTFNEPYGTCSLKRTL